MSSLGRYVIDCPIGEGAMAEIFLAHDPEIDRPLAIKILRKEFHANTEIVSRFLSEAKAAGALSHAGIVTIYDVGEADGVPYIVMELLKGQPLSDLLEIEAALPLPQVVSFGRQLADALQYAHERGVVHRDIKPSNIWVCDDEQTIKLLDFGIARRAEADRLRAEVEALRTQAGQVLGTPRYMSPEQALGKEIDHRTDFFSLGALMYEMITGGPAFEGAGLATIAIKITQESPVPLARRIANCPSGLAHIVNRLMEKSPDRRYASGAEITAALKREERALEASERAPRRGLGYTTTLLAQTGLVIAAILILSFSAIHARQKSAMRHMVTTSGQSMASFVAKNAALSVAENASLAPGEQDWLPLQEFIASAGEDPNIAELRVIDADGMVRASSLAGETGLSQTQLDALQTQDGAKARTKSFAFEQAIDYAGASFGSVELDLNAKPFNAAVGGNGRILASLGILIFAAAMGLAALLCRRLSAPLKTLREAINDLSQNNFNYRISHRRQDEFGDLFDRFNGLASLLQDADRAQVGDAPGAAPDPEATIVQTKDDLKKFA